MFVRYLAAVLLISSLSMYANPKDPYQILQQWKKRDAQEGEFSFLIGNIVGNQLGDFWREPELPKELPSRGALYVETQKLSKAPQFNSEKLSYLIRETLKHHRNLLAFARRSNNHKLKTAILEAFPELKAKNDS